MVSGEGGLLASRVEIDTRAPFRSVKEAVLHFGERVLVNEVYVNQLNETQAAETRNDDHECIYLGSVIVELEETRQKLEEANEERLKMANCLASLSEELEKTRMQLEQMKADKLNTGVKDDDELEKGVKDIEVEDVKFVENASIQVEVNEAPVICNEKEFLKKRCVTFADPLSLAGDLGGEAEPRLQRQSSVGMERISNNPEKKKKKKKKKPFVHLIAALLIKKKDHHAS